MPEDKEWNLDSEKRRFIERCLNDRLSLSYIARKLGVHTTTVMREIIRNRIVREGRINVNATRRNICKYSGVCTVTGICGPQCQGLFELIERRYMSKSAVLCTQYTPAEWHGRLGGRVQADAMVDRLVRGSVRINLGDVNVRKLLTEKR